MTYPKTMSGPKTPEGKMITSRNALAHGLLSRMVVLASEDASDFEKLREQLNNSLSPVGALEGALVDRAATSYWRLARAIRAERSTVEWHTNDVDILDFNPYEKEGQLELKAESNSLANNAIERILRYETSIERSFYRSIHELERIQAKRLGKEVAIPFVADISIDSSFRKNDFS